ncbi:hypothetical protein SAMN04487965_3042 [Microbulbifer donghaiensis]|uniref:DUF2066 domain-containing protein n=1 Tax=Microbulbifer donghaiensis TaxID=494016 RepID=A0A1M5G0R9_9GAMM|nr:DUF2066 domain-containing protein [Microbulbifer donghaiensis]SHF97390.1 hypothetical protein SAMN04487965_3042 [Microbulbifer donghaiensis]
MHKLLRHGLVLPALALLLGVLVLPAQARVIPDLYEVVEAVPSRGTTDRAAASSRGLERVFVRVTGDAAIGSNPQLRPVLQQAQRYVQGFRYSSEDNQLYLHLSFDPQAVSDQVHKLHLPMWPNNRPGTLVWMAVDTLQGGRAALREEDAPELFAAMDAMAIERGLPVDFPVMDLNDQRNMPLGNLWAQDERAAERAGVRYNPDATLMGRVLQASGQRWQANWLLIHGGRSYAFDASGNSLEEVALRGIDEAANLLAQRYAVRPESDSGPRSAVIVELSGVDSFADYTEASAYLQGLAQVSSADLLSVKADRMRVALTTSAHMQNLRDALALNRKLQAEAEGESIDLTGYRAPLGSAENPLRYRWH